MTSINTSRFRLHRPFSVSAIPFQPLPADFSPPPPIFSLLCLRRPFFPLPPHFYSPSLYYFFCASSRPHYRSGRSKTSIRNITFFFCCSESSESPSGHGLNSHLLFACDLPFWILVSHTLSCYARRSILLSSLFHDNFKRYTG
jgi:hypothetical protein